MIRQAVILCGGLGTRLGDLTARTPKPLLPVAGEPFLNVLIEEVGRHGFNHVLLLAGYLSREIEDFVENCAVAKRLGVALDVSVEPVRAGTAGAVRFAAEKLHENFALLNGDSWFDVNLRALSAHAEKQADAVMTLALRAMPDVSRYGAVALRGGKILAFGEKAENAGAGLVNGGVYVCRKTPLLAAIAQCGQGDASGLSLEAGVMPALVRRGEIAGMICDGYFIDIGVPESYAAAQSEIPARLRRPAVFFDRDGVLTEDLGHVGRIEQFRWIDGAIAAVRACNDRGFLVFVVTNQAGVAKGYYEEKHVRELHDHMQNALADAGAHVDDFRYCPYHVEATVPAYKKPSSWRKPAPGMLLDLLKLWRIDAHKSFLVGDKESDIEAAMAVGVSGYLFEGGDLADFLATIPECQARTPDLRAHSQAR